MKIIILILLLTIINGEKTKGKCNNNQIEYEISEKEITYKGNGEITKECSEIVREKSLENIIIEGEFESIEKEAFRNCSSIKEIKILGELKTIEEYSFANCNSLKKVSIQTSIQTIKSYSFSYCEQLKSFLVMANIETIEDYTFYKSKKLILFLYFGNTQPQCNEKVFKTTRVLSVVINFGEKMFSVCGKLTFQPWGFVSYPHEDYFDILADSLESYYEGFIKIGIYAIIAVILLIIIYFTFFHNKKKPQPNEEQIKND